MTSKNGGWIPVKKQRKTRAPCQDKLVLTDLLPETWGVICSFIELRERCATNPLICKTTNKWHSTPRAWPTDIILEAPPQFTAEYKFERRYPPQLWLHILKHKIPIKLLHIDEIFMDELSCLHSLPQLKYLSLYRNIDVDVKIKETEFYRLQLCPRLTTLYLIDVGKLTNHTLLKMHEMTNLTKLALSSRRVPNHDITKEGLLKLLSKLPRLTTLDLFDFHHLGESFIRQIPQSNQLTHITFSDIAKFTDACLALMQKWPRLLSLELCECPAVTDVSLSCLPSTLTRLDLTNLPKLKNAGLFNLRHLQELKKLILNDWKQLSIKGLEFLGLLPNLEVLDVNGCPVPDMNLQQLATICPKLTKIIISPSSPWATKTHKAGLRPSLQICEAMRGGKVIFD